MTLIKFRISKDRISFINPKTVACILEYRHDNKKTKIYFTCDNVVLIVSHDIKTVQYMLTGEKDDS